MNRKDIPIIVQARMSSNRLPGKVLRKVNGVPILKYVIGRLSLSKRSEAVIIATSIESSDDVISEFCKEQGVICHRGSLDNVALRFKDIIEKNDYRAFVRICADSPFVDASLIDEGIDVFLSEELDLVTNVWPRTFPKGLSFEIVKRDIFLNACEKMITKDHFEHLTSYFYENPDKYNIHNMTNVNDDLSSINLCVDTQGDIERFKAIVCKMKKDFISYKWHEIVALYKEIGY